MTVVEEMNFINEQLLKASDAYYNEDSEIMSNLEYDKLYDKLVSLETESGIVLPNSITQQVGSQVTSSLEKAYHETKMLSLGKTKSLDEMAAWASDRETCLSWKLDGLTVVVTYDDGTLTKAVTRGNGIVGEDITRQAKFFKGLPTRIDNDKHVVVRGEALITYSEFERINDKTDVGARFKNPRNLASGTVKTLDLSVLREREVNWIAFTFVEGTTSSSYNEQLNELELLGFQTVEHELVPAGKLEEKLQEWTRTSKTLDTPVDGLVVYYDNTNDFTGIGETSHHPKYAKAFKWQDEEHETIVKGIEWNRSRTGRVNPIAVFEPVEIDGTTVSRASLHNLSYIENMKLGVGDIVTVYKANMIIPQIAENKTKSLKNLKDVIPANCPVCGEKLVTVTENDSSFLECHNKNCKVSLRDSILLMTRQLGVKGLGSKTLDKLLTAGIVTSRVDLFDIGAHEEEWCAIDGLEKKGFDNLTRELENVSATPAQFLASLGIPMVSEGVAELITSERDLGEILDTMGNGIENVKGVGNVLAVNLTSYLKSNKSEIKSLLEKINLEKTTSNDNDNNANGVLDGKKFVVTGSLEKCANRKELETIVKSNGGKIIGAVSSTVDYLVTNDPNSTSSKARKARELGVKFITEQELLDMTI